MIMRRYYNNKRKYPYYFHPECKTYASLIALQKDYPDKNVLHLDNAEYECVLNKEEQENWYADSCNMIMSNTRYVLDNLDFLSTFRVGWNSYYASKKSTFGKPREGKIYNKCIVKPKPL